MGSGAHGSMRLTHLEQIVLQLARRRRRAAQLVSQPHILLPQAGRGARLLFGLRQRGALALQFLVRALQHGSQVLHTAAPRSSSAGWRRKGNAGWVGSGN